MSHICIIPGNNRSQAMACYHHITSRKLYRLVSMIESVAFSEFLMVNHIHLVVVEDIHAAFVIDALDAISTSFQTNALVIGSGEYRSIYHIIHKIAKQKQVNNMLNAIDLLTIQIHLARNNVSSSITQSAISRIYDSIRYIEYSHDQVFFHLVDMTFPFPYQYYQNMSFDDCRFITINTSTIVNIDALIKFDQHVVVLDQGEKIVINKEYREDCWAAICRYTLSKHHCRLLLSNTNQQKRISLSPLLKE